jgi:prephenate dehydrogenase
VVNNDTWQLFEDMHHFNPFAREKRRDLLKAMANIDAHLEQTQNSRKDEYRD